MDESGTSDFTGKQPGSAAPTVCGYMETPEYWALFCRKWKKILNNYSAPYFHFREFSNKKLCSQAKASYYGWSEKKRDAFLYDLAILAGESALAIGGAFSAKRLRESGLIGNPFEAALKAFFEDCMVKLFRHYPNYNGKVDFVYDRCNDEKLLVPIRKVHAEFAENFSFIGALTFEDDLDPLHLPLQAVDLLSYTFRQQAERVWQSDVDEFPPLRTIDLILNRSALNLKMQLDGLTDSHWVKFIHLIREDEKRQTAIWKRDRLLDKKYHPFLHFPFEKYGINITKREQ